MMEFLPSFVMFRLTQTLSEQGASPSFSYPTRISAKMTIASLISCPSSFLSAAFSLHRPAFPPKEILQNTNSTVYSGPKGFHRHTTLRNTVLNKPEVSPHKLSQTLQCTNVPDKSENIMYSPSFYKAWKPLFKQCILGLSLLRIHLGQHRVRSINTC